LEEVERELISSKEDKEKGVKIDIFRIKYSNGDWYEGAIDAES